MSKQTQWYRDSLDLHDRVVVDVGANVGELSEFFWEAGAREVVSVEPLPDNLSAIRERIARRGASNWRVEAVAASDRNGEVAVRVERMGNGAANCSVTTGDAALRVPARRLADLVPEAEIVKLDVEGHEYPILADALTRMPEVRAWAIEFHMQSPWRLSATIGAFEDTGFEVVVAAQSKSDASGGWRSVRVDRTLDWDRVPAGRRASDGRPFKMIHAIARRH